MAAAPCWDRRAVAVSVNLSANVTDLDLPGKVAPALTHHGRSPRRSRSSWSGHPDGRPRPGRTVLD